jgi:SAM-dependent methyltransferase
MSESLEQLICQCGQNYQIRENVLCVEESENYAQSFGEQWSQFAATQIDTFTDASLSEIRFFEETGWSSTEFENAVILDLGCGSGRFTEVASRYCKLVISVDLSAAVFAFPAEIKAKSHVLRIHGDIRNLPLDYSRITHVFSIGVLQHTPDPYRTLDQILNSLVPGTKFAFTAYGKKWYTCLQMKYIVRPFTKRIHRSFLLKVIKTLLSYTYRPLLFVAGIPVLGKILKFIVPFSIYPELRGKLRYDQILEFMILDSFDALTPAYDKPLSIKRCLRIARNYADQLTKYSKTPMILSGVRS